MTERLPEQRVGKRFEYSQERCPNPNFHDDGTSVKRIETPEDRDARIAFERRERRKL